MDVSPVILKMNLSSLWQRWWCFEGGATLARMRMRVNMEMRLPCQRLSEVSRCDWQRKGMNTPGRSKTTDRSAENRSRKDADLKKRFTRKWNFSHPPTLSFFSQTHTNYSIMSRYLLTAPKCTSTHVCERRWFIFWVYLAKLKCKYTDPSITFKNCCNNFKSHSFSSILCLVKTRIR